MNNRNPNTNLQVESSSHLGAHLMQGRGYSLSWCVAAEHVAFQHARVLIAGHKGKVPTAGLQNRAEPRYSKYTELNTVSKPAPEHLQSRNNLKKSLTLYNLTHDKYKAIFFRVDLTEKAWAPKQICQKPLIVTNKLNGSQVDLVQFI